MWAGEVPSGWDDPSTEKEVYLACSGHPFSKAAGVSWSLDQALGLLRQLQLPSVLASRTPPPT